MVYDFQDTGCNSSMPRSTSSIQFGYFGVMTVWPSMRVLPAILLTARHAFWIASLESNHQDGSSNGAPDSSEILVSLSRKISFR